LGRGESILLETNDNKDEQKDKRWWWWWFVLINGVTPRRAPEVGSLLDSETEIDDSESDFDGAGVGAARSIYY
jgi:hypothetical protein